MKALLLAAGRGERMRPLTEHTPKPLLVAGGQPLIAWHLEKLAALGITDVVVNTAHLAECFAPALGNGERWGLRLHLLHEGSEPLETGGGMLNALALLGEEPFLAINGDIWTDFDFESLPHAPTGLAHLVMVDNPRHHSAGDFGLCVDGRLQHSAAERLTFAGIGVYRPTLFDDWRGVIGDAVGATNHPPRFKLAPLLLAGMASGQITGVHHLGRWTDVGTPQRLADLDAYLATAVL